MNQQLAFKLGRAFKLGVFYGLGRIYATNPSKAQDAAKWITVKGAHIPVDEDGSLKGATGGKIEKTSVKQFPKSGINLIESPPSKNTNSYLLKAAGNPAKAIVLNYDNELRGGSVNTEVEISGKKRKVSVVFDGKGRKEFKKFSGHLREILEVLPFVPEVIEKGSYFGRKEAVNHSPQVAFHTKMKNVKVNGIKKTVAVDIGETSSADFHAYNVNTEGNRWFDKKKVSFEVEMKKRKARDAVLLPPSKGSVKGLHRSTEQSLAMNEILERPEEPVKMSVLGIRIL